MLLWQDWTERFSGLWQSQPRNFLLERAFNQLASRGRTRCCVCSIFDVHSPYRGMDSAQIRAVSERLDRGSSGERFVIEGLLEIVSGEGLCRAEVVRSLKVVVQRALIELPASLRRRCSMEERGESGQCRPRRAKRGPAASEDTDSQLITCKSCDITVHRGEASNTH